MPREPHEQVVQRRPLVRIQGRQDLLLDELVIAPDQRTIDPNAAAPRAIGTE